MYKTEIEKFTVGGNIDISVLREENEKGTHYVLFKIGLFGRTSYGICALGDGYGLEIIGENRGEALNFFDLVLSGAPAPCHIFDIVSDYREERREEGM